MSLRITHCICFAVSFAHLSEIARKYNITTVERLQEQIDFGFNCGLCKPYVQEMLKTGEVEFTRIIET